MGTAYWPLQQAACAVEGEHRERLLLVKRGATSRLRGPRREISDFARQETLGDSTILLSARLAFGRLRRSLGTAEATLVD